MFDLKKISFYYEKDKVILNNITLKLEKNEFYVIMGENGSGKSTLLMLLKGINKLKSGEFYFKNRKIRTQEIFEIFTRRIYTCNIDNYIRK